MKRSLYSIGAQVAFSGTNFLVGIIGVGYLSTNNLAVFALQQTTLLFICTIISSLIIVPYTLDAPALRLNADRKLLRIVYTGHSIALVSLAALVLGSSTFILSDLGLGLASATYSYVFLWRFIQRGAQIADGNSKLAFIFEILAASGVLTMAVFLYVFHVNIDASQLLFLSAFAVLPAAAAQTALTPRPVLFHRVLYKSFIRKFKRSGLYSLLGTAPSEIVNNGHIYAFSIFGHPSLVAHAYFASLFYRHITVLIPSVRSAILPSFVEGIRLKQWRRIRKLNIIVSGSLAALSVLNCILAFIILPVVASYFDIGQYDESLLQTFILIWGVVFLFSSLRVSTFSLSQALRKFRGLAIATGASASFAVVLYFYWSITLSQTALASAMILPGAFYSIFCIALIWGGGDHRKHNLIFG